MTRELDAKLHEALFKHPVEWRLCERDPDCGGWEEVQQYMLDDPDNSSKAVRQPCYKQRVVWIVVPEYSARIECAWLVVERLNAMLITVEITALVSVANRTTRYIVYSYNHETAMPREQAVEDSVALAICKVALKSVGVSL